MQIARPERRIRAPGPSTDRRLGVLVNRPVAAPNSAPNVDGLAEPAASPDRRLVDGRPERPQLRRCLSTPVRFAAVSAGTLHASAGQADPGIAGWPRLPATGLRG
jgi:hypothetical protein